MRKIRFFSEPTQFRQLPSHVHALLTTKYGTPLQCRANGAMVECWTCMQEIWDSTPPVVDPGFPVGGGLHPLGGGVDLRCGCFSVKMFAKMKELGPIGGGVRPARPPPRSANVLDGKVIFLKQYQYCHSLNNSNISSSVDA